MSLGGLFACLAGFLSYLHREFQLKHVNTSFSFWWSQRIQPWTIGCSHMFACPHIWRTRPFQGFPCALRRCSQTLRQASSSSLAAPPVTGCDRYFLLFFSDWQLMPLLGFRRVQVDAEVPKKHLAGGCRAHQDGKARPGATLRSGKVGFCWANCVLVGRCTGACGT